MEQNGHARVPQKYIFDDGYKLGQWVNVRRTEYNRGELPLVKIQQLESINGWAWDPHEEDFQLGLKRLREYVEQNQHARVPASYISDNGFTLGRWVSNRRKDYKQRKLTPDKIKLLEVFNGWVWDASK